MNMERHGLAALSPGFDSTELHWLREWHAEKFRQARLLEQKHRAVSLNTANIFRHTARGKADDYKRKMQLHMRAIQALNDVFDLHDNVDLS